MRSMRTPAIARRRSLVRLAAGAAFASAPVVAHAREPRRARDHDRAREALERGEALPLAEILARVRPELGGEVVGVSFERDRGNDGRWIYEFKVIRPDGRLVEVDVDARTARVLKREAE